MKIKNSVEIFREMQELRDKIHKIGDEMLHIEKTVYSICIISLNFFE